jgi:protein SCO1/2
MKNMKAHIRVFTGLLVLGLSLPGMISGQDATTEKPPEVGIEEKLGQTIPLDAEFYDESGNLVALRSLVHKPTILTFVYFSCPGICTPLLTEVSRIVEKMDLEPGKDYQIITISFDHRDTPELAADKKENYLSSIARPVSPEAWRWLTGDSVTIRKVTGGAIYEASNGTVSPTIAKILTFCYSYDPEGRRYTFNVLQVSMVVILLLVGIFVLVFIVIPRKKLREREATHGKSS